MNSALLAYTDDAQLASRSGYHVIAGYLPDCPRTVTPRREPSDFLGRLRAKVLRQFAFSRWCSGGSFDMENQLQAQIAAGYTGPVHYLWCDRDLAFLDRRLHADTHPLIGTVHQCADILPQAIRRMSSLSHFAAIIIMSETQRSWLISHCVQPSRIHRILHGVDVDYYQPLEAKSSDAFTALAVGGTRRNFALLKEVANSLRNHSRIRIEIIGPSDKAPLFASMTNVRFQSRVSDAELLSKYQTASCLLHLIEDSTANNVVNEALACGTPVISERKGGVPEYVTSDCAILCPSGDGAAVVQALLDLADSRQRQQEMSHAARAHAVTLDWRNIAAQTRQLYHGLS